MTLTLLYFTPLEQVFQEVFLIFAHFISSTLAMPIFQTRPTTDGQLTIDNNETERMLR